MKYLKAIVAAAVAALGTLSTALASGPVDTQVVLTIIVATLASLGAVWAVPNKTPTPTP